MTYSSVMSMKRSIIVRQRYCSSGGRYVLGEVMLQKVFQLFIKKFKNDEVMERDVKPALMFTICSSTLKCCWEERRHKIHE